MVVGQSSNMALWQYGTVAIWHSSNMALRHHVHMAPLHTSLSRTLPSEGLVTQQDIKASKYNIDASKYNKYQSLNIKWNIRIVRPQNTKAHRDVRSQYIKKVFFLAKNKIHLKQRKICQPEKESYANCMTKGHFSIEKIKSSLF